MAREEIETFIELLKQRIETDDLCVYQQGHNFDCCDCSLCRKVYFERVREELEHEIYGKSSAI